MTRPDLADAGPADGSAGQVTVVAGAIADLSVVLSAEQIAARVGEIGKEITRDYSDLAGPLLVVGVLKGAAIFVADLVRAIDLPVELDFVAIASYGAATRSSGEVRVLKDLDAPVTGKHVLLVDDVLDTGMTLRLSYLMESIRARHPASVSVCVLLDKPGRRQMEVPVKYRGFEVGDRFVVGYGMDYNERWRNLAYVAALGRLAALDPREVKHPNGH